MDVKSIADRLREIRDEIELGEHWLIDAAHDQLKNVVGLLDQHVKENPPKAQVSPIPPQSSDITK